MSDTIEIKVPDIGDFSDVEIIEVLVSAGDEVRAEDPLITLESDKATMEVPSPGDGIIHSVEVGVGDRISEGSVIATIEVSDAPASEPDASEPDTASVPAVSAPEPEPSPAPSQAVETHDGSEDEDDSPVLPNRRPPPQSLPPPVQKAGGALPHASPGVRRFARELGADLYQIRGSGPKGRITREDVKSFIKQRLTQPASAPAGDRVAGTGTPPIPEVDFSKWGEVEIQGTPRIKKLSGAHLHRAWLNIPHVTQHDEADITDLEAFRKQVNSEQRDGTKVTLLAFAMKAVAKAMGQFPLFNTSLSSDGQKLVYKHYVHIGIAVDTPKGLVVPVFRDVDKKDILELAVEMSEISSRARDGKLKPEEMQGGCMSISSLGGIGGIAFTPIVNAPEVAILGLSRSKISPVWSGSKFKPRLMLPMSLSYDHRVIDGAEAARFTVYLGQALADARRLLL